MIGFLKHSKDIHKIPASCLDSGYPDDVFSEGEDFILDLGQHAGLRQPRKHCPQLVGHLQGIHDISSGIMVTEKILTLNVFLLKYVAHHNLVRHVFARHMFNLTYEELIFSFFF